MKSLVCAGQGQPRNTNNHTMLVSTWYLHTKLIKKKTQPIIVLSLFSLTYTHTHLATKVQDYCTLIKLELKASLSLICTFYKVEKGTPDLRGCGGDGIIRRHYCPFENLSQIIIVKGFHFTSFPKQTFVLSLIKFIFD